MVGLSGLEPPTSRLSGVRSNRLSYKPILPFGLSLYQTLLCNLSITGGDMRDRTADPLLAKQVLSQLSYTPISSFLKVLFRTLKIKQRFKSFRNSDLGFRNLFQITLEKGGDPAAPSDTATLLRLHPSRQSYLRQRPPCG